MSMEKRYRLLYSEGTKEDNPRAERAGISEWRVYLGGVKGMIQPQKNESKPTTKTLSATL